jgi:hypothetical protein
MQYALNLPRDRQYLCPRTLDTYRQLLGEDEAAQGIFEEVTAALVKELGVEIGRQRLDSTHVFSNMAKFGRLKLLAVTTKRFLTQLKRHHLGEYEALPEELRARYGVAESRIFGFGSKSESDSAAVAHVIEQQQRMGTLPEEQLADTAYGSETNVALCAAVNVTLIAPVPGRAAAPRPKQKTVAPHVATPTLT